MILGPKTDADNVKPAKKAGKKKGDTANDRKTEKVSKMDEDAVETAEDNQGIGIGILILILIAKLASRILVFSPSYCNKLII